MKFPKPQLDRSSLNAAGLAHFVVPLVIVVLIALVGTYMLVASHANSVSQGSTHLKITSAKIHVARASTTVEGVVAPTPGPTSSPLVAA